MTCNIMRRFTDNESISDEDDKTERSSSRVYKGIFAPLAESSMYAHIHMEPHEKCVCH